MKFASVDEVQLAHSLGVVGTHAAITVRLPKGRRVKGDRGVKPGGLVQTTVGRVLFNIDAARRACPTTTRRCAPATWPA